MRGILTVKVAIYTRVSTEDQAREGFSLEAQRERLETYCEAQGWEVYDHYADNGHSGTNTRRPEYQRMMREKDRWDMVLVLKMDRIHRNSKNFMIMMENLEKWGKQFSSMQESLDTSTAVGRFVVDIIQRIAQLESEQIGERTYMGMMEKAERGRGSLGFRAPFGYAHHDGQLVQVKEEAEVVREVFSLYLEGETMSAIARNLNHRGISTKRDRGWSVWSISYLLHNPVYAGFLRWDGIVFPNQHEPIVSVKEFNEAQRKTASRIRDHRKRNIIELPEVPRTAERCRRSSDASC